MASRCCRLTSRYWRIAGVADASGASGAAGPGKEEDVVTRGHRQHNIASMVVLALETATRRGSVALQIDGALHARHGTSTHTHGERLPGELLTLLEDHACTLRD